MERYNKEYLYGKPKVTRIEDNNYIVEPKQKIIIMWDLYIKNEIPRPKGTPPEFVPIGIRREVAWRDRQQKTTF